MSSSGIYEAASSSLQDQLAQLRAQVEGLLKDKVEPALAGAAGRAADAADKALHCVQAQADTAAGQIRTRPLTAVLIAAVVGFALGRILP